MNETITTELSADGQTWRMTSLMPRARYTALLDTYGAEELAKWFWDNTLRTAHERGVVPVGSVLVGEPELVQADVGGQLTEGMPMALHELMGPTMVDVMKTVCEVMVGVST